MIVIGITGPTGSGKTTALEALRRLDFQVIDCDALYYELLKREDQLRKKLIETFGPVFLEDGQLDRKKLGDRVFCDAEELKKLNHIVFPALFHAVQEEIKKCQQKGVAIDAINLIESDMGKLCDFTVAITADPKVRLQRIMARDRIDAARAQKRIDAQKPDSYYKKHCTFVLDNRAGSRMEFDDLIYEFFSDLLLEE